MEMIEKKEKLKKEIDALELSKKDKEEFEELITKRNHLKFKKLYSFGRSLKGLGSGIAEWADAKNKLIQEEKAKEVDNTPKTEKAPENKPKDLYDAILGTSEGKNKFGLS